MPISAYLITFTCYGTHLHGSQNGSVDRRQNRACSPIIPPGKDRKRYKAHLLKEAPFRLEEGARKTVLQAAREVCAFRGWSLIAAQIRCTHVHLVGAGAPPEKVMGDIKAYASRALRIHAPYRRRFWTDHGSTRYLLGNKSISAAIHYVLHEQGKPMQSIFLKEPEASATGR